MHHIPVDRPQKVWISCHIPPFIMSRKNFGSTTEASDEVQDMLWEPYPAKYLYKVRFTTPKGQGITGGSFPFKNFPTHSTHLKLPIRRSQWTGSDESSLPQEQQTKKFKEWTAAYNFCSTWWQPVFPVSYCKNTYCKNKKTYM